MLTAVNEFLEVNNMQHLLKKLSYYTHIPQTLVLIIKNKKGCRSIYKAMQDEGHFPNSLQKWQDELRFITEPDFFERNSIYDIIYKFTNDPKITWFQFRINHRTLGTNHLLKI